MPIGAQAVVSAALGRADRLYRVAAKDGELSAQNQSQALLADFNQHGMRVQTKGGTHWGMALQGYGYGDRLESVGEATPQGEANRVEYRHRSLVEWYVNGPAGLEQGFTLMAPPPSARSRAGKASHANSSPLTIALRLGGDLTAATDSPAAGPSVTRAQGLTLRDRGGHAVLRYTGLNAHDANGRELVAWLELSGQEMRLRVDDAGAHYPLVVDPFIQVAKLTASNGGQVMIWVSP